MRLHSNTLTESDVYTAARKADVSVEHVATHGSRKRRHGLEVALSGSGTSGGQWGGGGYKSATWDEWGIFLAELYRHDRNMIAGSAYKDAEHFAWATGNRYDSLKPSGQHKRHKWNHGGRAATGSYYVRECNCGAVVRHFASGYTWEAIASIA